MMSSFRRVQLLSTNIIGTLCVQEEVIQQNYKKTALGFRIALFCLHKIVFPFVCRIVKLFIQILINTNRTIINIFKIF